MAVPRPRRDAPFVSTRPGSLHALMLDASVTLLVASDHEHRAFLHPSEAARRCTGGVVSVARPHGCPQMSHVIPLHVIQTLKSDRCNSNVFRACRKLTEGNYVRVFGEERLPPIDEAKISSCGHTCCSGALIDLNIADQPVKVPTYSAPCRVR